jgi:hypothetical protein
MRSVTGSVVLSLFLLGSGGCGGSQPPPDAPAAEPTPSSPAEPAASPNGDQASRPSLTAEACEAGGGKVVGDIGDGAVHRPDYRCPSGAAPRGSITAPPGGPIGVEGSVCCAP